MTSRRVSVFVEALRRNRRPGRFRARPEEAEEMRAAIAVASGRAGAMVPDPDFVNQLHHRLAAHLDGAAADGPAANVSRRMVIGGIGAAAAAAVAGAVVDRSMLHSTEIPEVATSQELVPDEGTWTPVVAANQVLPGQVVRFTTVSTVGFLVNDAGRVSAISGVCTHQGCLLRHNAAQGRIDCPCHRASFSLTGESLRHQFPQPLPALPHIRVRERDGQIEINDARPE